MSGPIEELLQELARRLGRSPEIADRVLDETREHLEESAAAARAAGMGLAEAEAEAVARFGSARDLSRALTHRRLVARSVALVGLLALCAGLAIATFDRSSAGHRMRHAQKSMPLRADAPIFRRVAPPPSVDPVLVAYARTALIGLHAANVSGVVAASMRSLSGVAERAPRSHPDAYAFPGAGPYGACIVVTGGGIGCIPTLAAGSDFGYVVSDPDGVGGQPVTVAGLTDSSVSSAFVITDEGRVDVPVRHGAFLWSPDDVRMSNSDITAIGVVLADGATQVRGS
jgi:hypothetical protein